jgi:pimeloyl-ACP methyl ester carboxylesterase
MRTVIFAHGLEGSPDGKKATALRAAGLDVIAPDGRGRPLQDRVDGLLAAVDAHPGAVLAGSSYGGLAALYVATVRADRLGALLLLAPALVLREPPVDDPDALTIDPALLAVIVHGLRDEVVPVGVSRALVARCPHAVLHTPDDTHDLRASVALIAAEASRLARG